MKIKYPRTPHCPWSEGRTSDDRVLQSMEHFMGKHVVVTEKMDGENCSIYRDAIHARSLDSRHHESRSVVKKLQQDIGYLIPEGIRICGENMYARHSISYTGLPSYFLGFSVWSGETCFSWEYTLEWFELLGIVPVRTLFNGLYDETLIKRLWDGKTEGYVIRNAGTFSYQDFSRNVAKFVRSDHVQSDTHWMHQKVVRNELA